MNQDLIHAAVLLGRGRLADAETRLRKVLSADPDDGLAHALLAISLARQHQAREAIGEARAALRLAPNSGQSHAAMGAALAEHGKLKKAVAAVEEAIQLEPHHSAFYGMLAHIHARQESWTDALAAVDRGLAIDAQHSDLLTMRAMLLTQLGQHRDAHGTIEQALHLNPESAQAHLTLGMGHLHRADYTRALQEFGETLRIDPGLDGARLGVIECLKARNPVYRLILDMKASMSSVLSRRAWLVSIAFFAAFHLAKRAPEFRPLIAILFTACVLFAYVCVAMALASDALLSITRAGRLALDKDQIRAALVLAVGILVTATAIGTATVHRSKEWFLVGLNLWLLVLPVSGIFRCHKGWPQKVMFIYTVSLIMFCFQASSFLLDARRGGVVGTGVGSLLVAPGTPPIILYLLAIVVAAIGEAIVRSVVPEHGPSGLYRKDRWILLIMLSLIAMLLAGYATYSTITPPRSARKHQEKKDIDREIRTRIRELNERMRTQYWQLLEQSWRDEHKSEPAADDAPDTSKPR